MTGSGAVGQDAHTAEDFADMAESFGPQTLQSWLAEVDSLRVALDRSLSNETSTGEVTYPLLQEVPQVLEDVKAQVKAYTLPKYKHGNAGEEVAEQGPSKGEGEAGTAAMATTATAPPSLSATGGKAVEQQPAAGSFERAATRTLTGTLSPLATSGKDQGITTAAPQSVGSPTHALSPSAGKGLSTSGKLATSGRLGSLSPKSPSRGGAMTPVSRAGQRRRREENETRPSSRARLSTFLDTLEAAHVLSKDDVNHFFAPLPLEPSSEMDEQMKELLERHLGSGPWQDIVASSLARPLDSELVFCDEAAQLGHATVAVRLGSPVAEGGGEGEDKQPVHLTVHTSVSSTLPIIENFPRTEFLQRLAEEHRREGRIQEAIACLQEASALLEQKQVLLPMAQAGQLFPYNHETFRAARIVQRLGRRRLRAKHAASTVIASHFRGFMARRGGLLLRVKRKVGAKIIQHQYRQHYGRRIRAAINVQKVGEPRSTPFTPVCLYNNVADHSPVHVPARSRAGGRAVATYWSCGNRLRAQWCCRPSSACSRPSCASKPCATSRCAPSGCRACTAASSCASCVTGTSPCCMGSGHAVSRRSIGTCVDGWAAGRLPWHSGGASLPSSIDGRQSWTCCGPPPCCRPDAATGTCKRPRARWR